MSLDFLGEPNVIARFHKSGTRRQKRELGSEIFRDPPRMLEDEGKSFESRNKGVPWKLKQAGKPSLSDP